MNAILKIIPCLMAVSAFAGETYWVDDDGDDAYSGTSATVTGEETPGGVPIGPKHSLKAGMALAKSGDTVKVLPGAYCDEVCSNGNYTSRVAVKDGVKLVSTGGRDKTFICGAPSPTPEGDAQYGIGADAVRCVYLLGTGSIFGFTLTGGRTVNQDALYGYGGGVLAAGEGAAVDCVISNCCAVRGGAASGSKLCLVNSIVDGCMAYPRSGRGQYLGSAWGCIFRNMNYMDAYSIKGRNCTIDGAAQGSNATTPTRCWNTVVLYADGGNVIATNSCLAAKPNASSDWSDPKNQTELKAATQLATDADYMPVKGSHVGIDCADWDYYTNGFPSLAADYLYKDVYGKRRVVNGKMDLGAVECDYLQAFTDDLADGLNAGKYFRVTNFTDNVYEKAADSQVAIPVGGELLAAWTIPATDTQTETYTLTVALSGDAVLKVYADGVLKLTQTASGTVSYAYTGSHGVRFVCEGTSGEAVLSGLMTTAHKPYYVAPAPKGNDANDGLTADTPKETLAAIAAIATESGAIIHAARGVYDKGVSGPATGCVTTNRVIVAEGVGLQGDEGADVTIIEGLQNTGGYAYATNVIRCCYLKKGAWIRGFTLRGGAAAMVTTLNDCGGGLVGETVDVEKITECTSAAIECIFTNNVAYRGNSVSDVDLIRCRVYGTGNTSNPGFAEAYGYGRIIDSVFANAAHAYTIDVILNSTFDLGQVWASKRLNWCTNGQNMVCNSIIGNTSSNRKFCNCLIRADKLAADTSEADADCRFKVNVALDANYRPLAAETNAVDRGKDDYYETYFPARWTQFRNDRDFAGGARRIGSSIDIGAGEFGWSATAYKGLVITVTEGTASGTWNVTVAREDADGNTTTGFSFRGETVRFAEHPVGWSWAKTVTGSYPTATEFDVFTSVELYVNPVTGDDDRAGWHPDLALATITRAMEKVAANGTIHCAAGTYAVTNGNVHFDGTLTNVVYFTQDGVTLVADEGSDKTFIEGVLTEGSEAVRGVSMQGTSQCVVRGFTIRNCATPLTKDDLSTHYGAGVRGGTAVDCVISNCWSGNRGGAAYGTDLVRCFVGLGNKSPRTGYGTGGMNANYYGCVFLMPPYENGHDIVNCLFIGCAPIASGYVNNNVYNTMIVGDSMGRCNYHNCVLTGRFYASEDIRYCDVDVVGNVTNASKSAYAYDPATYRPLAGSKLIDAGSNETFVAEFPEAWQSVDLADGQRIYNGRIDIGAGEYDARPDFAQRLARRITVDTATPTVELGEGSALSMQGGDTLALRWQFPIEGTGSFRVLCEEDCQATVTVNGVVRTPDEKGVYSFAGTVGEQTVSIVCTGSGSATVDSFVRPRRGVILLVR